jgi:hypothetical protein
MKYIIYHSAEGPRISLFAAPTIHAEDAAAHPGWKPTSAGFVAFRGDCQVECFGRSDSLNLAADPQDAMLIRAMTYATLRLCSRDPVAA